MSASISFLNSSPVGPPGGGAPAGTKKPLHRCVLTSGKPVSVMLGTSGNSGERAEPVTASARVLPPCTNGIAGGPSEIVNVVCPATTLKLDSLLLLYTTCTAGIPVLSLNNSIGMVKAGDDVA